MTLYVLLLVSPTQSEQDQKETFMYKMQRVVAALIISTVAITAVAAVEATGAAATVAGPKDCC